MYNLADEGVQFSPTQLFIQSRRGCSASNGQGVQLGRYIHPGAFFIVYCVADFALRGNPLRLLSAYFHPQNFQNLSILSLVAKASNSKIMLSSHNTFWIFSHFRMGKVHFSQFFLFHLDVFVVFRLLFFFLAQIIGHVYQLVYCAHHR